MGVQTPVVMSRFEGAHGVYESTEQLNSCSCVVESAASERVAALFRRHLIPNT